MVFPTEKEQDDSLVDPNWLDQEDSFGLNEEMEMILFKCLDCHKTDEVPAYNIGEFSVDLNEGEELKIHCPYCNGTMIETR